MQPVVLITRPEAEAQRLAEAVTARAGDVRIVISPLQEVVFDAAVLADLAARDPECALIFTSRNGVRSWRGGARVAYCVGDATAELARAAGHDAMSADGNAEDLKALILRENPGVPLLHLRGRNHRGDLVGALQAAGLRAEAIEAYQQRPCPPTPQARAAMTGVAPIVAPLYSPRSARLFADAWQGDAPLLIAAISPMILPQIAGLKRIRVEIAAHPGSETMLGVVTGLIAAAHQLETRGGGG
ncbi:uroporphyrinogen-III synthase [Pseudooceanicola sediminis]|uniref:Uroporphyrinogen-III synthase n=1 Tax=Pseudooceanicola sediminis TaxID=2211117 RepID=A0A399J4P8_9RHOB|nr:uroporphyrinogen-III synthase [Pseudooceanicola sediminis]KAA2315480.1 uroporphyrinogen-III synthase [Puniceibacterium sp. HSS470]RII40314.1 uroporphyrinogen-III synthase [Pseudooceanicola sediminis]|tara:strand:- start:5674 stop:6402 length:729 start_codon:yes stop_codon:yes gene_type:complete